MAAQDDDVLDRVGERLDLLKRELLVSPGADADLDENVKAALADHKRAIAALEDVVRILAAEIDALRHQASPPC